MIEKLIYFAVISLFAIVIVFLIKNSDSQESFYDIPRENISPDKLEGLIPYDYEIVNGEDAEKRCIEMRRESDFTPVIFGGLEEVERLFSYPAEESADTIIRNSLRFDMKAYQESWLKEQEYYSELDDIGDWPVFEVPQMTGLIATVDILSGRPLKQVVIGLVPTSKSYEVPAYLKYGDWNECPAPDVHVGIWRYWKKKYGAEIISVTGDIIECTVENPPHTKEEALELAKEQYIYCPDIVYQGTETISNLAATLIDSKYWYFWWD